MLSSDNQLDGTKELIHDAGPSQESPEPHREADLHALCLANGEGLRREYEPPPASRTDRHEFQWGACHAMQRAVEASVKSRTGRSVEQLIANSITIFWDAGKGKLRGRWRHGETQRARTRFIRNIW